MRRIFLRGVPDDSRPQAGSVISVDGGDAVHLATVLRMKPGDRFQGVGGGWNMVLEITEATGRNVNARVVSAEKVAPEKGRLTVLVSYPKERAMPWLLEKGTEAGVSAFIFTETEHVERSFPGGALRARYERIVEEAAKQSGRWFLPSIDYCHDYNSLDFSRYSLKLAAYEKSEAALGDDPLTALIRLAGTGGETGIAGLLSDVLLFIGPEGGFSPADISNAVSLGFSPTSLGDAILRVETAVSSFSFFIRMLQTRYCQ